MKTFKEFLDEKKKAKQPETQTVQYKDDQTLNDKGTPVQEEEKEGEQQ